tara:strand:- start:382 stop:945 length:564 start_codon:yes stop_codon:yes gene_type:complete
MFQRTFIAAVLVLIVGGCASGGSKITDFSDRSVGYGWLDIKDIDANRLHSVVVFQHRPQTSEPYYNVAVKKFKDGYLYYSFAFPKGAFKTYSAEGQFCIGLCGNTIHSYSFGKQGDAAAVIINEPGVYHFGSYKLQEVKTGLFEQGKFEAVPANNAPTQKEMLQEILKDTEKYPTIAKRINQELGNS